MNNVIWILILIVVSTGAGILFTGAQHSQQIVVEPAQHSDTHSHSHTHTHD
jgi:hypothetical protein